MKLIVLLIVSIAIMMMYSKNNLESFESEPCGNNLTDKEYLIHMIPHHQVAVDISVLLQKKLKILICKKYFAN